MKQSFCSADDGLGWFFANIIMNNGIEKPKLAINKWKINSEQIYVYNFPSSQKVLKVLVNTIDWIWSCELLDNLFYTRYEDKHFTKELVEKHIWDIVSIFSINIFDWELMYSKNKIKTIISKEKWSDGDQKLTNTVSQWHAIIKEKIWGSNQKNRVGLQQDSNIKIVINKIPYTIKIDEYGEIIGCPDQFPDIKNCNIADVDFEGILNHIKGV